MGKYDPLGSYMTKQSRSEFELSFAEIEAIIEAPLPKTALTPQFWSNVRGENPLFHYARRRAWLEAGYKAFLVSGERKVRFKAA